MRLRDSIGVPLIVIPALNVRDGASVQLTDAIDVARAWAAMGFSRLHVTDLDAAAGRGDNAAVITSLLHSVDAAVQVGGDVRTIEEIDRLLDRKSTRLNSSHVRI